MVYHTVIKVWVSFLGFFYRTSKACQASSSRIVITLYEIIYWESIEEELEAHKWPLIKLVVKIKKDLEADIHGENVKFSEDK